MRNDCQHHETQMGIRLESWELDPKWVLYNVSTRSMGKPDHPEFMKKTTKTTSTASRK
ncbi:MAG: hypothetical protein MJK14_27040 [Rivularia sp. ALOHA_DT_140]|nr:hypothetical protein [Rivularia sp. ALOHA_DT_140]